MGYLRAMTAPKIGQIMGAIRGMRSSVSSSIRVATWEGKRKPGSCVERDTQGADLGCLRPAHEKKYPEKREEDENV